MDIWNLLITLAVGALAGWAASKIMKSKGGLFRNIVVGIVGSFLGSWVAGLLGISAGATLTLVGILVSIGGACLLIFLCRLVLGKK